MIIFLERKDTYITYPFFPKRGECCKGNFIVRQQVAFFYIIYYEVDSEFSQVDIKETLQYISSTGFKLTDRDRSKWYHN